MQLIPCLIITLFISLTSCNGQSSTRSNGVQLSNNIMLVYQDKQNNYWFSSWEDGLYKYDGKTLLHFSTKDGLPHNRIDDIKEDAHGNLILSTSGGFCRFDGKTFTTIIENKSDVNPWLLNPNDLWFKNPSFTGGAYRYDGKNLYALPLPENSIGDDVKSKHLGAAVYSVYKDSHGNVWFGTNPAGVCRYNGISFDWITEEDVTEYHNGPANGVRSIIEDKDGYFWFNSKYRYKVYGNNPSQQPFYKREKSIGSLDGSPDDNLIEYLSIAKTKDDNLWIATYGNGVWRYDPNLPDGKNITYYPVTNGKEDITLFTIYKDNRGDLWLGTHENGVYKFNGKTFERFRP